MKIRNGFVSNSSSSAFLLDLCDEEVERYAEKVISSEIGRIQYPTRCTGQACGEHLIDLIHQVLSDDYIQYGFLNLMLEAAVMDRPLVLMESDEGMGGYLPDGLPTEKVLRECEYH